MLEILGLIATGGAAIGGYAVTRDFVRDRLRFVDGVRRTRAPVVAGTVATLAAAPVVWALPVIGAGTAVVFGLSVATGVALGARDARRLTGD